jgi:hypothetical protein
VKGPLEGPSRAAQKNRQNAGIDPRGLFCGGRFGEDGKLVKIKHSSMARPRSIARAIARARARGTS